MKLFNRNNNNNNNLPVTYGVEMLADYVAETEEPFSDGEKIVLRDESYEFDIVCVVKGRKIEGYMLKDRG